jgi:hypothetical protein
MTTVTNGKLTRDGDVDSKEIKRKCVLWFSRLMKGGSHIKVIHRADTVLVMRQKYGGVFEQGSQAVMLVICIRELAGTSAD